MTCGPASPGPGVQLKLEDAGLPEVGNAGDILAPIGKPNVLNVTISPASTSEAFNVYAIGVPAVAEIVDPHAGNWEINAGGFAHALTTLIVNEQVASAPQISVTVKSIVCEPTSAAVGVQIKEPPGGLSVSGNGGLVVAPLGNGPELHVILSVLLSPSEVNMSNIVSWPTTTFIVDPQTCELLNTTNCGGFPQGSGTRIVNSHCTSVPQSSTTKKVTTCNPISAIVGVHINVALGGLSFSGRGGLVVAPFGKLSTPIVMCSELLSPSDVKTENIVSCPTGASIVDPQAGELLNTTNCGSFPQNCASAWRCNNNAQKVIINMQNNLCSVKELVVLMF